MATTPHNEEERWLPIPSAEGYEASNLGNVRSVDRAIECKGGVMRRQRGKVLSPAAGPGPQDRLHVVLGRGKTRNVHVLVAEAFLGPRPDGHDVCHNNGDRFDNRAENLRYDTHSNNQKDMVKHGTCHTSLRKECPRGHPLVLPNLRKSLIERGRRECLACHRARAYLAHYELPLSNLKEVADSYHEAIIKGDK